MLKKLLTIASIFIPVTAQAAYNLDLGGGEKLKFHKPYVKGYLGYGVEDDIEVTVTDGPNTYKMDRLGKGYMGAVGMGAAVEKNWRVELEYYANEGMYAKRKGAPYIKGTHYTQAIIADVYYDFDAMYKHYRPYVLGGLGVGWTKFKLQYNSISKTHDNGGELAWQLGAGVNRSFGDFDIDVGYRMISLGQNNYSFTGPRVITTACIIHAGIVGVNLRF